MISIKHYKSKQNSAASDSIRLWVTYIFLKVLTCLRENKSSKYNDNIL